MFEEAIRKMPEYTTGDAFHPIFGIPGEMPIRDPGPEYRERMLSIALKNIQDSRFYYSPDFSMNFSAWSGCLILKKRSFEQQPQRKNQKWMKIEKQDMEIPQRY